MLNVLRGATSTPTLPRAISVVSRDDQLVLLAPWLRQPLKQGLLTVGGWYAWITAPLLEGLVSIRLLNVLTVGLEDLLDLFTIILIVAVRLKFACDHLEHIV